MKIGVVVSDLLNFGGLEEFAKNLAIGVRQQGHEVSVLCAGWAPADNQYLRQLRAAGIPVIQLPRWLARAASNWDTKQRILRVVMALSLPLVLVLALTLWALRRKPLAQAWVSAYGWLRGQWMRLLGPDHRQPFVRLLLALWRWRWHYDVLHIHGYTSTLLFVIDWAHVHQVPVVYQEHQTPDAQFDWWKDFKASINKATIVVGVSEKSAQALREVCGVTQPVEVAYYMVPDPYAEGWRAAEPVVSTNGMPAPIRLTTLARLYVTKGLNYLLDTIVLVKKVHPQAQFKVYGDGPLREELLAYARQLGLKGEEIFVGAFTSRQELSDIFAHTDIYVMSSILEGLPISLLEAMSYARPIVTTPAGGSAEAIKDGVNGILCEMRNPARLADAICRLIEDPALRQRLGQAARKSYEQGPFLPATVCKHFIAIYQDAIGSRQSQPLAFSKS
jgi:glycosyltransferase involved in cell wall biosynthesis